MYQLLLMLQNIALIPSFTLEHYLQYVDKPPYLESHRHSQYGVGHTVCKDDLKFPLEGTLKEGLSFLLLS